MSENNEQPAAKQDPHHHTRRDAETQMILGAFVTVISIPVLIGTFWATTPHARIVNVVAGLVLLGVGLAIALWGLRTKRSL